MLFAAPSYLMQYQEECDCICAPAKLLLVDDGTQSEAEGLLLGRGRTSLVAKLTDNFLLFYCAL